MLCYFCSYQIIKISFEKKYNFIKPSEGIAHCVINSNTVRIARPQRNVHWKMILPRISFSPEYSSLLNIRPGQNCRPLGFFAKNKLATWSLLETQWGKRLSKNQRLCQNKADHMGIWSKKIATRVLHTTFCSDS